jgi:hypothetical protein
MNEATPADSRPRPTREQFIEQLIGNRFSREFAEQAADQAAAAGQLASADSPQSALAEPRREAAEYEAFDIAMAVAEGRTSTRALAEFDVNPHLATRFAIGYPVALARAGIDGLDLVERFPVLSAAYGYTRGGDIPEQSRIVPFRNRRGGYRLYGSMIDTEAFFIRLDPVRVATWLSDRGHDLPGWPGPSGSSESARLAILNAASIPTPSEKPTPADVGADLLTLVHSFAHRLIRQTAVFAGIDRDALSEYLVPLHLGFFLYAAARGDFVLGGLQAVFESELDELLTTFVESEHRCALDPGCSRGTGACTACLHLGEPSCRLFNTYLDRSSLFGSNGWLRNKPIQ